MARFGRTQPHKPLIIPFDVYPDAVNSKLLQESGFYLLQEDSSKILLEQIYVPPTTAIKTFVGLAYASTKVKNGLALASIKNANGLA